MKTEHQRVREAIQETARGSSSARGGSQEFLALARLAMVLTPEGAAKLRRLLK